MTGGSATHQPRIEWKPGKYSSTYGYVRNFRYPLFTISYRTTRTDPAWFLRSELPGMTSRRAKHDDLEVLQATAEKWLTEFVNSLGAVFLGDPVWVATQHVGVGVTVLGVGATPADGQAICAEIEGAPLAWHVDRADSASGRESYRVQRKNVHRLTSSEPTP